MKNLTFVSVLIAVTTLSGCTNILQVSTVVEDSKGYVDGYPCSPMQGCDLETAAPIKGEYYEYSERYRNTKGSLHW